MTDASLPKVGDTIDSKYTIVRFLGEGGMGVVFEVVHERLEQRFAVKMLQPKVLAIEEYVTRFEREARAAAQLRSRHTARVVDVAETPDGVPYMVMELLEGCDISEELALRGRLPVGDAVDYVLQACRAMTEAHEKGVVHRDLKPSNLFLANEAEERVVKVLDFGISKMHVEGQLSVTSTTGSLGTPLYMSPEQIRSSRDVDARTDIWSLGVILFELLDGHAPFIGMSAASVGASIVTDPPRDLGITRPDVPPELAHIIARTLEKDPNKRFASARELAKALGPFAPAASLGAQAAQAAARPLPPPRDAFAGGVTPTPAVAPTPAVSSPQARTPMSSQSFISADTVISTPSLPAQPDPVAATNGAWAAKPAPRPVRAVSVAAAVAMLAVLVAAGGIFALRGRTSGAARTVASPAASSIIVAPPPRETEPSAPPPAPTPTPTPTPTGAVATVASAPSPAASTSAPAAPRDGTKPRATGGQVKPKSPPAPVLSSPPADNPVRL